MNQEHLNCGPRRVWRRPSWRCGTVLLLIGAFAWTPVAGAQQQAAAESEPWRLGAALGTPDWLHVSGSFIARFESLNERLRRGETGSDQGLFTRALVEFSARDEFTEVTVEMMDARISGEPDDARTTTGQVNTAELLQGYFKARGTGAFVSGDQLSVLLGRHTMDIGSRRLVARNRYRNTINAFTGVNAEWSADDGRYARAFYTLPVQRLPGNGDIGALRDGDVRFDEERTEVRFFGGVYGWRNLWHASTLELTYLGLHEQDGDDLATRNRRFSTLGARFARPASRGEFHWDLESAFQFGKSRASAASGSDLDHDAYLHHAALGYTFDDEWSPRIEALFDMASGDRSPNDGENNRFDSLFGIPRQDFGPTGLFRAIARSNIVSPGLRINFTPAPRWNVTLMQRFSYLASDRDAWNTGLVDPTGNAGAHIGNLSELILRYELVERSALLEFGAAYHAAGGFAESVQDAASPNDALFGYAQIKFIF